MLRGRGMLQALGLSALVLAAASSGEAVERTAVSAPQLISPRVGVTVESLPAFG